MYADKFVHRVADIPKEPHFAIVTDRSYHVEGDERSRTHPGHGYPARTEYYVDYEVYLSREKWEAAIAERESEKFGRRGYLAIEVRPAKIIKSIHVNVEG